MANRHDATIAGFGDEWTRFNQADLSSRDRLGMFSDYFSIFPPSALHPSARGADFGAGSGRWAILIAPKVGTLICVDASAEALAVARSNLSGQENCEFIHSSLDNMPIEDSSLDFGYSLGVLHHIPDTLAAMKACVAKLKPGAPFLVYIYYRFDNRPAWYRWLWRGSTIVRLGISRAPLGLRYWTSQAAAALVYWPLARSARLAEKLRVRVDNFPLSWYRDKAFYVMRTDALDRFGTQLENRFTRAEIEAMMRESGLTDIRFSDTPPYWGAVGWKETV